MSGYTSYHSSDNLSNDRDRDVRKMIFRTLGRTDIFVPFPSLVCQERIDGYTYGIDIFDIHLYLCRIDINDCCCILGSCYDIIFP